MAVYIINNMTIRDRDEYRRYERSFLPLFLEYGGEVLAVHDGPAALEGDWPFDRTVLLRMPSEEKARAWYESEGYQTIARHRWNATQSNVAILPAFAMPGAKSDLKIAVVTYIHASAARVWDALTNPDVTVKYWAETRIESDWQIGSKVLYRRRGEITDEQTVLRCEPPHLLSYTFHPLSEEFRDEAPSRVTFELAAEGDVVRLAMTHDEFAPNSKVHPACSQGWPKILSNLKTLLETGRPLPELGPRA